MTNWIKISNKLDTTKRNYFSRTFNLDPLIVDFLYQNGLHTEKAFYDFLFPNANQLHDPFLLNDMSKAVYRILKAIENNERILIFGDYDVDGITSTTIMYNTLKFLKANVFYKIPLRNEGYGLSLSSLENAIAEYNCSLIVTVDNGSSSHEAVDYAKKVGIDVIVTDHHDILNKHPNCLAFINPKRTDSTYPFDKLSGAGVAFKLAHALLKESKYSFDQLLLDLLELAAVGTVADLMPLIEENRAIVSLGTKKLTVNPSRNFGFFLQNLSIQKVDSSAIGFSIGPILNSSGRIGNPNDAVELLSGNKLDSLLVKDLINYNELRKKLTHEQVALAERNIEKNNLLKNDILVICDDFNDGIIGIIASRISSKYHKPCIVISYNGRASCRSVPNTNFSIINVIDQQSYFLEKFGGHDAAAGFSILIDNVDKFIEETTKIVLNPEDITPTFQYLSHIPLNKFPKNLFEEFSLLEPFGKGNEKPIFYSQNTTIQGIDFFGKYEKHAKFYLPGKEAVQFFVGNDLDFFADQEKWDFLYTPDFNVLNHYFIQDATPILKDDFF